MKSINNNVSTYVHTYSLIIVVPCYNEENRLPFKAFKSFINLHNNILVCFVNDGSSDNTIGTLTKLKNECINPIEVVNLQKNKGKAAAVREGITYCNNNYKCDKIGYLDADLSTSLDEYLQHSSKVNSETVFVFGSRIEKADNNIQRKKYRFIIGRFIAFLIARQLQINVYDTQCGCKIFNQSITPAIFNEKFISKWLFDVEIFHRLILLLGKETILKRIKEVPLKKWTDTEDSRVSFTYFFKIWIDLYKINKKYRF